MVDLESILDLLLWRLSLIGILKQMNHCESFVHGTFLGSLANTCIYYSYNYQAAYIVMEFMH